jgi:DNA-binding transcriptional LysR family regulator
MQPMANQTSIVWDDLRVILAIARKGSHAGAGQLLHVDPTTVGRRMAALELAFGAKLFDRTPSGLSATPEGRILVSHAERAEAEILAAERALGGADKRLSGTVRLTASDGLLHYVVVPALGELRRLHPDVTLELRADTRALDLSRREADVALRLTRPVAPALVARRYAAVRVALYGSRAYFERRGVPRSAAELAEHQFVGFDPSLDDLVQSKWLRKLVGEPRWALRATTITAQAFACEAGLGLCLLGTYVAARMPALVPVLPALAPPPREAWLVVHRDVRKTARVAAVLDWLSTTRGALGS